jgi:hypothetical protein
MASDGLRVLGLGRATLRSQGNPLIQHDFDFEFSGMIGFSDPIRESVPDAVKECFKEDYSFAHDPPGDTDKKSLPRSLIRAFLFSLEV